MTALTKKWIELIKKETGARTDVDLIGEDKIKVFVTGEPVFDVACFFMDMGKDFDIECDGILVSL